MNKVEQVQGLRRSNAATAVPARKPGRRGGRGEQRRAAIRESKGERR